MHDLNTINRLNVEAFAESIANYRKQGRYVLAKYEGLHLVSIETFIEQQPAQVAFDVEVSAQHGGSRAVLFAPLAADSAQASRTAVLRDQSEDRQQPHTLEQLAALGAGTASDEYRTKFPADVILNVYINCKTI